MSQTLRYSDVQRRSDAPWVVMAHGFGANAADLLPLVDVLDPSERWNWIFPEAPVPLGGGVFGRSYAWFPRTEEALQRVTEGSYFLSLADISPPGLADSGREVLALLESLGISGDRCVFGGFSQGSMVALEASLLSQPRGLILFSSALIGKDRLSSRIDAIRNVPYVQTHGREDPILAFRDGEALSHVLSENDLPGEFLPFHGGHEIPPVAIGAARSLLESVFAT